MKSLIILCVLFISGHCFPTSNSKFDESWSLFRRVFEKKYFSNEEEIHRRQIWEENVAMIHQHNLEFDLGMHNYTLEINQFGDMTNEEFRKQMNGFKMDLKNQPNQIDRHTFLAPSNVILPDSVDWRPKGYVTPIKDQGQCGSCWAFSTTGALEGQHFAKTSQLVSLSEQNLVDCSLNLGCDGGNQDLAFHYIKSHGGIDTESTYPYDAKRHLCHFDPKNIGATLTGYVRIKKDNETDLQAAIATIGPIAVSIDASQSSFQFYSSGVYNEPHCSTRKLDHAVLAVGYGTLNSTDYYIVKNSWGTNWGSQGYILMSRNKQNQCGIATSASYPLV
jgi:cathepsin L